MIKPSDADKWNQIYQTCAQVDLQPAKVLIENQHLLPDSGKALDAACGLGANALLLAVQGLETYAWDISKEALDRLAKKLVEIELPLTLEQRDIVSNPPEIDSFDVIVVTRFLDRQLIPKLKQALRQYGLIYYQTFIRDKSSDTGPKNPEYRLENNELLSLFSSLHIVLYHEEGTIGNAEKGFRNEAMLIAQKR